MSLNIEFGPVAVTWDDKPINMPPVLLRLLFKFVQKNELHVTEVNDNTETARVYVTHLRQALLGTPMRISYCVNGVFTYSEGP